MALTKPGAARHGLSKAREISFSSLKANMPNIQIPKDCTPEQRKALLQQELSRLMDKYSGASPPGAESHEGQNPRSLLGKAQPQKADVNWDAKQGKVSELIQQMTEHGERRIPQPGMSWDQDLSNISGSPEMREFAVREKMLSLTKKGSNVL